MIDARASDRSETGADRPKNGSGMPSLSRKPLWLALAAGALVPLSMQPWGVPWLLPVAFTVLAWSLKEASIGKALLLGWLFGLVVEAGGLPWIGTAVSRFLAIFVLEDPGSGIATAAGFGAFIMRWPLAALGWGLCSASIMICPNKLWVRAIWSGICFVVLESYWPRIFRWTMGAAFATEEPSGGWLLLQWFGVEETLLLTVVAGFLAASCCDRGWPTKRRRLALLPALVLMVLPVIPLPDAQLSPLATEDGGLDPLTVSIVQPAFPLELRHGREQAELQLKKIRSLIEIASDAGGVAAPALILLPEGILPQMWKAEWLQQWSQDWLRRPAVIGLTHFEDPGFSNAVALLLPGYDSDRRQPIVDVQIGSKKVLLPFGETVPFGELLSSWGIEVPITQLVAGEEAVVFSADGSFPKLGISICYEGILPDIAAATIGRGARWHANLTEDLWYGDWVEPAQHLQLQRSRAIETGLIWLRSVNAGISVAIDPRHRGRRLIVASRLWTGDRWSDWQPTTNSGQLSLPAGNVGILQIQVVPDFSPRVGAPLSLPSSRPLLWIYCLLGLFWFNLKRFQPA